MKSQEEQDAERKKLEHIERQKQEEERISELKPKTYSQEEIEAYNKYVDDINNVFAEIHMR